MELNIHINVVCDAADIVAIADKPSDRKLGKDEIVKALNDVMPEFQELVSKAITDKGAGNLGYKL